ncbi:surfeit locus protein 6 [Salminus brasiliensis]|uniref:surfeit locus protein 6 n=1 Tax=Salminus brasiliensis TaxID=930266 RepID=UPI003B833AE8
MSSLAAKYDYLEKLTRKVCHSQTDQPRHKPYVPFRGRVGSDGGGDEGGPPKKKQKKKQKPTKGNNLNTNDKKPAPKTIQKAAQKQTITEQKAPQAKVQNGHQVQNKTEGTRSEGEFNAVDILRKRLHQKIEESRGQGPPKDPSSEEVQKRRAKRKQERERKKRKRKEFRMKKAQSASTVAEEESKPAVVLTPQSNCAETKTAKKDTSTIVFNKVEVEADYVDKGTKLREKKKKRNVKGTLTPLVGRNYKQLLTRVEARKARLEELREKDEEKAKKEEEKMKWTNMLYKAEGMKIKDNEQLLRASLKRKEKSKAQRKKKWTERSQLVVEKMQQRQDKRRRNIQKRKDSKMDKRKQRARKKGRVLPEDLKKAAL